MDTSNSARRYTGPRSSLETKKSGLKSGVIANIENRTVVKRK
jgi:hypothetical protein